MFALICAYLCVPGRFRFIVRWLAMGFFIFVLLLVLAVFARVLLSVRKNHGHSLFHPQPHQPLSPDFIAYRPHDQHRQKEGQ